MRRSELLLRAFDYVSAVVGGYLGSRFQNQKLVFVPIPVAEPPDKPQVPVYHLEFPAIGGRTFAGLDLLFVLRPEPKTDE